MAEATAAAQATGEILVARYGSQAWVMQVMDAVQNAVQIGIENLSGSNIDSNAQPGDMYRFRARTKDELIQSQSLVADSRTVDPSVRFSQLKDPASQQLGSPKWEVDDDGTLSRVIVPPGVAGGNEASSGDGDRSGRRRNPDPLPWML